MDSLQLVLLLMRLQTKITHERALIISMNAHIKIQVKRLFNNLFIKSDEDIRKCYTTAAAVDCRLLKALILFGMINFNPISITAVAIKILPIPTLCSCSV